MLQIESRTSTFTWLVFSFLGTTTSHTRNIVDSSTPTNTDNTNGVNVITIDGGADTGKSTTAKKLAETLGWRQLQSGLFYRVFSLICLRSNTNPGNEAAVERMVVNYSDHIHLVGEQMWFDDQPIKENLHSKEIGAIVSQISAYYFLRMAVLPKQRLCAENGQKLIAEGRDMGTTVFPNARWKIFLTANVDTCAQRELGRLKAKGDASLTFEEVKARIIARDHNDSHRHVSPCVPASDAFQLDTSHLTEDQVVEAILGYCASKGLEVPVVA
jgi:CMP/dCMP kinase